MHLLLVLLSFVADADSRFVSTIVAKQADERMAVLSALSEYVTWYWGRAYSLCPLHLPLLMTQYLCLKIHLVINLEFSNTVVDSCLPTWSVTDKSQPSRLHSYASVCPWSISSGRLLCGYPLSVCHTATAVCILVSSILNTWPSPCNCDAMNMASISVEWLHSKTSLCITSSCCLRRGMAHRCHKWNFI